MKQYISCFNIDEHCPLPAEFFGKWVGNESLHEADYYLKISCHPQERFARLMTREQAIAEAIEKQEECMALIKRAMEDWSYSFK